MSDFYEKLVLTGIQQYEQEVESRVPEFKSVEKIYTYNALEKQDVFFPGCVIALVGKSGSAKFNALLKHFEEGNFSQILLTIQQERQNFISYLGAASSEGTPFNKIDVLAEVRYKGKTLTKSLFVKEDEILVCTYAYTGGELDDDDFKLIEFRKSATDEGGHLSAIIVKVSPELTPLEEKVLSMVPKEVSEANISSQADGDIHYFCNTAIATAIAAYLTGKVADYVVEKVVDYVNNGPQYRTRGNCRPETYGALEQTIKTEIEKIPPHATVADLLKVRKKLLFQE